MASQLNHRFRIISGSTGCITAQEVPPSYWQDEDKEVAFIERRTAEIAEAMHKSVTDIKGDVYGLGAAFSNLDDSDFYELMCLAMQGRADELRLAVQTHVTEIIDNAADLQATRELQAKRPA